MDYFYFKAFDFGNNRLETDRLLIGGKLGEVYIVDVYARLR